MSATEETYDELYEKYRHEQLRVSELKQVLLELRSYTASYIRDNHQLLARISDALMD